MQAMQYHILPLLQQLIFLDGTSEVMNSEQQLCLTRAVFSKTMMQVS